MSGKKIIIGQSEWGIDDRDVESVVEQIKAALADDGIAELTLLDSDKRAVTVYVNAKLVPTVVIDLDRGARPTEVSG